jgi:GABA(A) receptor-associated protein
MFSLFKSSKSQMSATKEYKERLSLEERKKQSANILTKYPTSVPLFIDSSSMHKMIDKPKFVIPDGFTIGQLMISIRARMKMNAATALFIFIDNQLIPVTTVISAIYESHKDEDGYLYVCCSEENTFG